MDETVKRAAVLYADISGSTRLYEQYGDSVARSEVAICLQILSEVAARLGGQTIKTIGDEVMCAFPDPAKAAVAAGEMHLALREASEQGRFRSGTLRVKIGWHCGEASWRRGELRGEAPVTAQQIIRMAKAGEVLTSAETLAMLPPGLKAGARFIDRAEAEAWTGELEVFELPWEDEDELTSVAAPSPKAEAITHSCLVLTYNGLEVRAGQDRPHVKLGRSPENDLPVNGRFTSREHAHITYRHGRFHLRDASTNGTVVIHSNGDMTRLHLEEIKLAETGAINLGGTSVNDPAAEVQFRCE